MQSEQRNRTKRRYLYSAHRDGDRVVKQYIGPLADAAVQVAHGNDQIVEARNRLEKQGRQRERDTAARGEQHLINLSLAIKAWPTLERLYDRVNNDHVLAFRQFTSNEPIEATEHNIMQSLPCRADFAAICRQVDAGDEAALEQFRYLALQLPDLLGELTDLVAVATEQTINVIAGDSLVLREALRLQLAQEATTILGDANKSPLDRMHAEILMLLRLDAHRCHVAISRAPEHHSEHKFWTAMSIRSTSRFNRAAKAWGTKLKARRDQP